jgi:hypothetical protein
MAAMPSFTPTVIRDRKFQNQTIKLDGFRFERCEFIDCTLVYAGGPADCSGCGFHPDTQWRFEGQAQMLMVVLERFGWRLSFGDGPPDAVIRFPSDAM